MAQRETNSGVMAVTETQRSFWGIWTVLLISLWISGCGGDGDEGPLEVGGRENQAARPAGGTGDADQLNVTISVLGQEAAEVVDVPVVWREGMTVWDVLQQVEPQLEVDSTGQGETLFVQSIGGRQNLGAAGDNWVYRVNGKLGDRSCAVYPVEAGDQVIWSFGKYE